VGVDWISILFKQKLHEFLSTNKVAGSSFLHGFVDRIGVLECMNVGISSTLHGRRDYSVKSHRSSGFLKRTPDLSIPWIDQRFNNRARSRHKYRAGVVMSHRQKANMPFNFFKHLMPSSSYKWMMTSLSVWEENRCPSIPAHGEVPGWLYISPLKLSHIVLSHWAWAVFRWREVHDLQAPVAQADTVRCICLVNAMIIRSRAY